MIQRLNELNRLNSTLLLGLMTVFCFSLSLLRYTITDTKVFLFLNWNLFLAFLPWLFSSIILYKAINNRLALSLLIFSWLLFFPNSPYILTDLFHLRTQRSAPIWFDLVVILSFAWTGLMYGFISLMDLSALLQRHLHTRWVTLITVFFLFLASFGVYLGRYLRWNSWDILSNPFGLFSDILDRFVDPLAHPTTWGVTILFGVLLNMMYWSLRFVSVSKSA